MHRNDTTRSDRVMLFTLAIVLAMVSATFGAAATYHPAAPAVAAKITAAKIIPAAPQIIEDAALDQLVAEHRCLTEALYYEARGEGRIGEQAVAEVVFHRLRSGAHGPSICAVVYEGSFRPGCQFSFTCDGQSNLPQIDRAWETALTVTTLALANDSKPRVVAAATHYHADYVDPYWSKSMHRLTKIGRHIFYSQG